MKIIFVFLSVIFLSSCAEDDKFFADPRSLGKPEYKAIIFSASKSDKANSDDLFLAYYLMSAWDHFYKAGCEDDIQNDFEKFPILFYKSEMISTLKKYCHYSIQQLIKSGDNYLDKTKPFNHHNIIALYLYYAAYIQTTQGYIDENGDIIPSILQLSKESYDKFKATRGALPGEYVNVSPCTPFDESFDANCQ